MKLFTMRYQDIHHDFKRQSAQECLMYTCMQEYTYNNMLYRPYRGTDNEIQTIGSLLEAETSDRAIIRALINKVKKTDMSASGSLLCYLQDVSKMINTYRLREVYTPGYYSRLVNLLYELFESTHSFRVNVQGVLLNKLESLIDCKLTGGPTSDFGPEQIEEYCVELEEYLCNLRCFYRELSVLLQAETDPSHYIALLTPVQEYLQNMVNMTEAVLYTTECTQFTLQNWCFCLGVWELQEMYN